MGTATTPGLVKKETLIIGVLVALAVGFMGGVIYSSFKSPVVVAGNSAKPMPPPPSGQMPEGPNAGQAAQIANLELEVGRNAGNGAAWTQLGNLYFDSGQAAKAIVAYNKSLQLNQGQPDVWTDLGVMYRSTRQFKEAIGAFEQSIKLNPNMEQAYFNMGVVLIYDQNNKAAGIEAWQKAVAINPNARTPAGQLVSEAIKTVK